MALSKESKVLPHSEKKTEAKDAILGIVVDIISIGAVCFLSYGLSRYLSSKIQQPHLSRPSNQEAKDRLMNMLMEREIAEAAEDQEEEEEDGYVDVEAIREKVRRKVTSTLELNEYETAIAEDVIDPNDITTAFKDVGGIDDIKAELWDLVCLPILRPDLFQSESGLVSPPRGILLYGQPGTGKTMLAKAIAKESGATFVNVRLSNIMDKWFGESNKLVSATFSLARKLAPSVIFIDEIDTFLNQRDSSEGSATTSMKSEFLTLWDGMLSDSKDSAPITVIGATNRPYDVDSAILRRLPRTFEIGLPNAKSRLQILNLFLESHELTLEARAMIPAIANVTEGYSGSDLKELCKAAAMVPIREITREASRQAVMMGKNAGQKKKRTSFGPPPGVKIRPVSAADFKEALEKVKKTGEAARLFRQQDLNPTMNKNAQSMGIDMAELATGMQMLQMLMSGNLNVNTNGDDGNNDIPTIN